MYIVEFEMFANNEKELENLDSISETIHSP